jgi:hypothetical protein
MCCQCRLDIRHMCLRPLVGSWWYLVWEEQGSSDYIKLWLLESQFECAQNLSPCLIADGCIAAATIWPSAAAVL